MQRRPGCSVVSSGMPLKFAACYRGVSSRMFNQWQDYLQQKSGQIICWRISPVSTFASSNNFPRYYDFSSEFIYSIINYKLSCCCITYSLYKWTLQVFDIKLILVTWLVIITCCHTYSLVLCSPVLCMICEASSCSMCFQRLRFASADPPTTPSSRIVEQYWQDKWYVELNLCGNNFGFVLLAMSWLSAPEPILSLLPLLMFRLWFGWIIITQLVHFF